jgi:hypothetical protein
VAGGEAAGGEAGRRLPAAGGQVTAGESCSGALLPAAAISSVGLAIKVCCLMSVSTTCAVLHCSVYIHGVHDSECIAYICIESW